LPRSSLSKARLTPSIQAIDVSIAEVYTASGRVGSPGTESAYRHVLETLLGAGPVVAATLLGEIPDIQKFGTAKQFVAFIGLDASVQDPGQFQGTRMHISERGCAYLRRALWYCALAAMPCDRQLSGFYARKLAESKHSKVAIVALMRNLDVTIFHVWRTSRPYDPEHEWKPTSRAHEA